MAACVAVGLEGRRGLVAVRTASSRRPRGVCLAPQGARSTFVPRTCARRQARAAWGQPPLAWPLCGETPGRTKAEAPRRWPGPSVMRQVEGEERANRGVQAEGRLVVVPASHLAQPHAPSAAAAHGHEAEAVADHGRQVHPRWLACQPSAAAASAEDEGRAPGGLTRSTMASWQRAAARAAPGEDGQRRRPQPRPSQGIAWRWRSRGGVIPRKTMAGRSSPRRCALRRGRRQRCSRHTKTTLPRSHLVCDGSRPPRPSLPCGSRTPNGSPPWRGSSSSAGWSPGSCSGRCAFLSIPLARRCQGPKARQRYRRRRWGYPCLPREHWSTYGETIKGSHRCMGSKPITSCSVTRWVSTPHGMQCPQRTKAVSAARPLERGLIERMGSYNSIYSRSFSTHCQVNFSFSCHMAPFAEAVFTDLYWISALLNSSCGNALDRYARSMCVSPPRRSLHSQR